MQIPKKKITDDAPHISPSAALKKRSVDASILPPGCANVNAASTPKRKQIRIEDSPAEYMQFNQNVNSPGGHFLGGEGAAQGSQAAGGGGLGRRAGPNRRGFLTGAIGAGIGTGVGRVVGGGVGKVVGRGVGGVIGGKIGGKLGGRKRNLGFGVGADVGASVGLGGGFEAAIGRHVLSRTIGFGADVGASAGASAGAGFEAAVGRHVLSNALGYGYGGGYSYGSGYGMADRQGDFDGGDMDFYSKRIKRSLNEKDGDEKSAAPLNIPHDIQSTNDSKVHREKRDADADAEPENDFMGEDIQEISIPMGLGNSTAPEVKIYNQNVIKSEDRSRFPSLRGFVDAIKTIIPNIDYQSNRELSITLDD